MAGGAPTDDAPGPPLVGRDDDLEQITAFADEAAVSGGALLLSGEAGVGKTVLLDAAAAHAGAAGTQVLRAAGTEFEGGSASLALTSCSTRWSRATTT
jgi:MoxR-like ATPase